MTSSASSLPDQSSESLIILRSAVSTLFSDEFVDDEGIPGYLLAEVDRNKLIPEILFTEKLMPILARLVDRASEEYAEMTTHEQDRFLEESIVDQKDVPVDHRVYPNAHLFYSYNMHCVSYNSKFISTKDVNPEKRALYVRNFASPRMLIAKMPPSYSKQLEAFISDKNSQKSDEYDDDAYDSYEFTYEEFVYAASTELMYTLIWGALLAALATEESLSRYRYSVETHASFLKKALELEKGETFAADGNNV